MRGRPTARCGGRVEGRLSSGGVSDRIEPGPDGTPHRAAPQWWKSVSLGVFPLLFLLVQKLRKVIPSLVLLGIALGPVSGAVRIDAEGEGANRQLLELSGGDLPPTPEFRSGRIDGTGRGILYGPDLKNLDLNLNKNFVFREGKRLEFRAEAFNASNTPHYALPAANVDLPTAGRITSAGAPRQIQFGLKLVY